MTNKFNIRLFNLENKIVNLHKDIEALFPVLLDVPFNEKNPLKYVLIDMLDLINEVRLCVQDEKPKEWWTLKVKCNSQEILAIKEQAEVLELKYELLKPEGE